jgi:uncharacterized protein (DUF983 family)
MGNKRVDLSTITLDEIGRAVLSDDILSEIEALVDVPSAGGLNGYCPGSSNGSCFNTYCNVSSNGANCTNQIECNDAKNFRSCMPMPI